MTRFSSKKNYTRLTKHINVFRTDASNQIGSGHVMRCLTLARELAAKGAECQFACRAFPGNMIDFLRGKGITVHYIPHNPDIGQEYSGTRFNSHLEWLKYRQHEDAAATRDIIQKIITKSRQKSLDCLIVDHYSLDIKWEKNLRALTKKIMVIDDMANRLHDCDLLLDQNLHDNMGNRYRNLVPEHCVKLLGPGYSLLRPEFREARKTLSNRDGTLKRVFISFGGADPTNETSKTLKAIKKMNRPDIKVDVVVGASNSNMHELENAFKDMPEVIFRYQVENMAELMAKADLAIGAGGSTTWERCFVGLPAITITVAENQLHGSKDKNLAGSQIYLGKHTQVGSDNILSALNKLINDKERLLQMKESAYKVMSNYDYHAVTDNITNILDDKVLR